MDFSFERACDFCTQTRSMLKPCDFHCAIKWNVRVLDPGLLQCLSRQCKLNGQHAAATNGAVRPVPEPILLADI